jgi:hypothetical protein
MRECGAREKEVSDIMYADTPSERERSTDQ